ncbi:hypothetical protein Gohar_010876 [Gossypium harknessii]|uniref:Uncharacterized protein n=1 Tax=Gossypium harknessii TaxID=34285 RepID=A0A7J9GS95_9ROSI|nr:hypothetical protein [Gossypium harknessii]
MQWKENVIKEEFSNDEADGILKIPLMKLDIEDKLVWNGNNNGIYSVGSECPIAKSVMMKSDMPERVRNGEVSSGVDWIELAPRDLKKGLRSVFISLVVTMDI